MTQRFLFLSLWQAEWRSHPLRLAAGLLALALGVALGYAVHLVNQAAVGEFAAALRTVAGAADLEIRGPMAGFDERLYDRLAATAGIAGLSPVLEFDVGVAGAARGPRGSLRLVGIDALAAAEVSPALLGRLQAGPAMDRLSATLFLSDAALRAFGVGPGEHLRVIAAGGIVALPVAGDLPLAPTGQRLATIDIAAAQQIFGRIGRLNRIDLRLDAGADREAALRRIAQLLPDGALLTTPEDSSARSAALSRAYRVNLTVLALVALFTGAFLVFATQALSVIRRRAQIALLRVLGLTPAEALRQVLMEGAVLGLLGGVLGVALGYLAATLLLEFVGPDLGGGYFMGLRPAAAFHPGAAAAVVLLAVAAAIIGSLAPAREVARASPAQALKAGDEELPLARTTPHSAALFVIAGGIALVPAPPLDGLPIAGYGSIALLLIGGVMLMPPVARAVFGALARRCRRPMILNLALARLAGAPGQAAAALAGILASFSLMVAMAIMVGSFRIAVDEWLVRVLPADLYLRPAGGADSSWLTEADRRILRSFAARSEFSHVTSIVLDPRRPPVSVIARPLTTAEFPRALALTAPQTDPVDGRPVWVSEAMVALYRMRQGDTVELPLGGRSVPFVVAGVWRDYARQFGAIALRHEDYLELTGDARLSDAALWLPAGKSPAAALAELRARLPAAERFEILASGEIRALSLVIFDRSFAVTYVLTAAAILIGLFSIAATFSAQVLSRLREFGMLRHVGVTRGEILRLLATEGGLVTGLGALAGLTWGGVVSAILVHVVNPQSFHWTMELVVPWDLIAPLTLALILTGTLTATLVGRRALAADVLHSVRDDW